MNSIVLGRGARLPRSLAQVMPTRSTDSIDGPRGPARRLVPTPSGQPQTARSITHQDTRIASTTSTLTPPSGCPTATPTPYRHSGKRQGWAWSLRGLGSASCSGPTSQREVVWGPVSERRTIRVHDFETLRSRQGYHWGGAGPLALSIIQILRSRSSLTSRC